MIHAGNPVRQPNPVMDRIPKIKIKTPLDDFMVGSTNSDLPRIRLEFN